MFPLKINDSVNMSFPKSKNQIIMLTSQYYGILEADIYLY